MARNTEKIIFEDGDGVEHELTTRYEVCPSCQGRGTSCAYLGSWTASEWAREDDEFKEDYLAGLYDRACEECGGLRVIAVADEDRNDPKILKQYRELQQAEAESRSIERMERLMEGGWREEGWYGRDD